ncbi:MAG: adenylate/guanylate cyclase domain-containing protein [Gemmatimonadetes bacterium]|nr:adenylate/guanylate cyclase domain-containing protein [Gemmatimonadota bacterium]
MHGFVAPIAMVMAHSVTATRFSPRTRRNLLRILPFGVIWFLLAQVFLISDYGAAGSFADVPDTAIVLDARVYLFASLAVAVIGCMVGAVELLYLNRRLSRYGLTTKLVAKTLFYMALLTGVMVVTFPIAAALEMGTGLGDPRVRERLGDFLISKTSLATGVQLTTSLVASLFYAEIAEHMGPQVLTNFITGRYHTPKEERRVFLFSDMKASTTIAERLGHRQYFELLRAYYDALADAIVDHGGQVYQYIGDEIVVSWPEDAGVRDAACLRCVLRMKGDLEARAGEFRSRFGVVPEFRAGLQTGPATTGELGALKKDIVFSGDVLNQTARIQALCKDHGVDLLLGGELRRRLDAEGPWGFTSLGRQLLRGKDEAVEVFAVEPA